MVTSKPTTKHAENSSNIWKYILWIKTTTSAREVDYYVSVQPYRYAYFQNAEIEK